MKRLLAFTLPMLAATVLPLAARSASITLNPSKDNTIYSESGTLSNGAGTRVFAGENGAGAPRRALIRFDLSAIAANAIVDSVVVQLTVVQTHGTPVAVTLHRLLADWGEGTSLGAMGEGGGGNATPGDATWTQRFYLAPAALWSTPGGDFSAASASHSVLSIGTYAWRSGGLNADVAFWLANSAQNFGWEVIGNESVASTAKAFGSRQNATPSVRPALTVYYTVPTAAGAAPALTRLLHGGAADRLAGAGRLEAGERDVHVEAGGGLRFDALDATPRRLFARFGQPRFVRESMKNVEAGHRPHDPARGA